VTINPKVILENQAIVAFTQNVALNRVTGSRAKGLPSRSSLERYALVTCGAGQASEGSPKPKCNQMK
jgi:hypothetical protein